MFDSDAFAGHESLHLFHDAESGLRGAVALHSTVRGPGGGGVRMWNYASSADMIRDALRLSEGMSYKNAIADLPLGGGKAVIWGDSRKDKTPELFRALGRAIESLNGRYWSAEDVGVSPADLKATREETRYVAGLDDGPAASGDPSPHTALGVFLGLKEVASRALGTGDLSGVRIAVQGVGHVGGDLCRRLADAGAILTLTDINGELLKQVAAATGATATAPDAIYDVECDIFSPNALGAVVNPETIDRFQCKAIAGSANNQLLNGEMGRALLDRGIVYAPDFVINGGGIINVASEISGTYSPDWVRNKLDQLAATLGAILDEATASGRPPGDIALDRAKAKIQRPSA